MIDAGVAAGLIALALLALSLVSSVVAAGARRRRESTIRLARWYALARALDRRRSRRAAARGRAA